MQVSNAKLSLIETKLPDEILHYTFSFLDFSSLANTWDVNQRWRRYTNLTAADFLKREFLFRSALNVFLKTFDYETEDEQLEVMTCFNDSIEQKQSNNLPGLIKAWSTQPHDIPLCLKIMRFFGSAVRSLKLSEEHLPEEVLVNILPIFPNTQKLSISGTSFCPIKKVHTPYSDKIFDVVSDHMKGLKHLRLHTFDYNQNTLNRLSEKLGQHIETLLLDMNIPIGIGHIFNKFPNLSVLKLGYNEEISLNDADFISIANHLPKLKKIKAGESIISFADGIKHLTKEKLPCLEELDIPFSSTDDIEHFKKEFPNLKQFSIFTEINEDVKKIVTNFPRLENISMHNIGHLPDELYLADITKHLTNLKRFRSYITIQDQELFVNFAKKFQQTLTHLDLFNSSLTDEMIIQSAPYLSNLEILNLGFNTALSDPAVEAITTHMKKLRKLNLSSTKITDESLKLISENLSNLTYLSISSCDHITEDGMKYIFGMKCLRELAFANQNGIYKLISEIPEHIRMLD